MIFKGLTVTMITTDHGRMSAVGKCVTNTHLLILTTLLTGKLIPSSADIYGAISACAIFLALFIDICDSVVASPLTPAPHDTRGVSVSDASPEPWLPAGQYYFSIQCCKFRDHLFIFVSCKP